MLTNSGDRLEHAIKKRRYRFIADFARRVGIEPGTLRQQINRGSIPAENAAKCARVLKIPLEWLIDGKGPSPFTDDPAVDRDPEAVADKGQFSTKDNTAVGPQNSGKIAPFGETPMKEVWKEIGWLDKEVKRLRKELELLKAEVKRQHTDPDPQKAGEMS